MIFDLALFGRKCITSSDSVDWFDVWSTQQKLECGPSHCGSEKFTFGVGVAKIYKPMALQLYVIGIWLEGEDPRKNGIILLANSVAVYKM